MATSVSYRVLKKLGLNFSEGEYGNVSLTFVFKRFIKRYKNAFLLKYCMFSILLSPLNYRLLRPKLWRWMGAKVGKNVFIGYEVLLDTAYAEYITLEDNVHIANRCTLLCHQRDISNYYVGDDYSKLPYKKGKILLKKGCLISTNCMVMPGVTIGEGAIVGAFSLVTKDIPPYTIAVGRPAKVVKKIPQKEEQS
jgi:acetyltransferase-like isoleucine patch superfamily enzyme